MNPAFTTDLSYASWKLKQTSLIQLCIGNLVWGLIWEDMKTSFPQIRHRQQTKEKITLKASLLSFVGFLQEHGRLKGSYIIKYPTSTWVTTHEHCIPADASLQMQTAQPSGAFPLPSSYNLEEGSCESCNFFFTENRIFFPQILYPDYVSPPSTSHSSFPPPLPSGSTQFLSVIRK